MRNGLRVLLAAAFVAGAAACDTGGDEVELYEGEEAATPSLETTTPAQPADAAVMTAQFEAAEGATEAAQVSGTVRVFADQGTAGARATPGAGETETPDAGMDTPTTDREQGFRVEVSINGLTQGEHAWHIHDAPCGEQGPIVVAFTDTEDMEGLASALNVDQDAGRAESTASVPADQLTLNELQNGEYSLHVHMQGGVDHGPTVACADLSGQGTTTTM